MTTGPAKPARVVWIRRAVLVAAAGALHAQTFAPGGFPIILQIIAQLVALAVLVRVALGAGSVRAAFGWGFLFALTTYTIGLYWLYISMHVYGMMVAPLAAGGVLALSAYLALYPALACALSRWLTPWPASHARLAVATPAAVLVSALVFAAAWTVGEWLRGTIMTGFPWLNIGYAHVDSPLAGWAPVLGVYGMAGLAAFCSVGLASLWRSGKPAQPTDSRRALTAAAGVLVLLAGTALGRIHWSEPSGEPLRVDLIQGNVPQSQKFDPQQMQAGIVAHLELAAEPVPGHAQPALVLLPETVLPVFQDQLAPQVWAAWRDIAQRRDTTLVMGAPLRTPRPGDVSHTNSVIGIDANTDLTALRRGITPMRYDKAHLVPFGEFVPLGFRWFVDAMQIPLGDFDRGPARQQPFAIADQQVAFNICYEDLFGEELLPALHAQADGAPGATILANVSNLGWFGRSWALDQHLQIARLRTLETARPMLASTNTGITSAIDHRARVYAALASHQPGVLPVTVQGMTGLTPYARWGNLPAILLALAGLIGGSVHHVRRHRHIRHTL